MSKPSRQIFFLISQYTDMLLQLDAFVLVYVEDVQYGNFYTSSDFLMDSNVYLVHLSVAFHTPRKCSNLRGSLYPSIRHGRFPLYLQLGLYLRKYHSVVYTLFTFLYNCYFKVICFFKLTPLLTEPFSYSTLKAQADQNHALCPLAAVINILSLCIFAKFYFIIYNYCKVIYLLIKIIIITFTACCAFRCKHSMVVINTINLIIYIYCKWNTIETFITNAAAETAGMIRFTHRLKYLKFHKKIKHFFNK